MYKAWYGTNRRNCFYAYFETYLEALKYLQGDSIFLRDAKKRGIDEVPTRKCSCGKFMDEDLIMCLRCESIQEDVREDPEE